MFHCIAMNTSLCNYNWHWFSNWLAYVASLSQHFFFFFFFSYFVLHRVLVHVLTMIVCHCVMLLCHEVHVYPHCCRFKSNGPVVALTLSLPWDRRQCIVFFRQVPALSDYQPQQGPFAGGTNITVKGSNMDIGSNVSVTLSSSTDSVQCQVYS